MAFLLGKLTESRSWVQPVETHPQEMRGLGELSFLGHLLL